MIRFDCRQDPGVQFHRFEPAGSNEFSLFQNAQDEFLRLVAKLGEFIDDLGASLGAFDITAVNINSAFATEQLLFSVTVCQ